MSKLKFYKLGEKAGSFFDPESRMKVIPGTPGCTANVTKKIKTASGGGHLIAIDEEEFDELVGDKEKAAKIKEAMTPAKAPKKKGEEVKNPKKKSSKGKEEEEEEEVEEEEEEDEVDLDGMSKSELDDHANSLDWDEETLEKYNKLKSKEKKIAFIQEHTA